MPELLDDREHRTFARQFESEHDGTIGYCYLCGDAMAQNIVGEPEPCDWCYREKLDALDRRMHCDSLLYRSWVYVLRYDDAMGVIYQQRAVENECL